MVKHLLVAAAVAAATLTVAPEATAADTPTCVTRAEFRNVHRGMTKARVHRIFDVSGQREVYSTGGGYSFEVRSYRPCTAYSVISIGYDRNAGGAWRLTSKTAVWS